MHPVMTTVNCIKTISTPVWILRKCNLWPDKIYRKTFVIKLTLLLLLHGTMYIFLIIDIINAINFRNSVLLNWLIGIFFPITNCYLKAVPVIFNRSCFFSILDDLECGVFNFHNEKLNKHIQLIHKVSNIITKYLTISIGAFALTFCILPLFTNGLMMIPPPFNMGKFKIVYKIFHVFAGCHVGYNCGGFDILYLTFMALGVAQLNILNERLLNINEDAAKIFETSKTKKCFHEIINDLLKECVILHERINRFVDKLNVLLSLPLFYQYVSGCLMICSSIIQITVGGKRDTTSIIGLCGHASTVFAQMSAYHYLGNEIIFKSGKIVETCYLSNWYKLDLKFQTNMMLIMERSKTPLIITVGKFVFISLESLVIIVQWTYSVFALMKAKYN